MKLIEAILTKRFPGYSLVLWLFSFVQTAIAQERSYTQYDVNSGLAGSTVYTMLQDHDGFMWFGTETGVSRFDGTHFKNFGVDDGMPDNEIIYLFEDSKQRMWMVPFKRTICFYHKGKFYSSKNDSVLKQIKPKSHFLDIAEDQEGNILLAESDELFLISKDGVKLINTIDGKPFTNCLAVSRCPNGGFFVLAMHQLFEFRNQEFHFVLNAYSPIENFKYVGLNERALGIRTSIHFISLINLRDKSLQSIPIKESEDNFQLFDDSLLITNGHQGSSINFLKQGDGPRLFLSDKSISRSFVDNERNYWFATLGNGVFRLSSENVSSITLTNGEGRKLGVHFVSAMQNEWIVGADMMNVFAFVRDSGSLNKKLIWDEFNHKPPSRTMAVEKIRPGLYLIGSDQVLEKVPLPKDQLKKEAIEMAVKSISRKPPNEYLVASNRGVYSFTVESPLSVKDTFWRERATTAYYYHDTAFIGTLDGLFLVANDRSRVFAGDRDTLLQNRINTMRPAPDGILWIASDGAGLMAYKNGRIIQRITTDDGLSSNNCRALWVGNDELWLGTDKGLNRIMLSPKSVTIMKLTVGDGLSSNLVNSVDVDGDTVLIATPEGLNYFDKTRLSFQSRCNLVMDKIIVSNHELSIDSRSFYLPHADNNIRFEFAGISFRSGGEMKYEFQLAGLDTAWNTTTANLLNYPTLPSGDYTLRLRAVNKFGVKSNLIVVPFSVEKLLIEKTWFRIIVVVVMLGVLSLIIFFILHISKRRDAQRNDIRNRIAELEQLALKSQMNPHFIFNCLNSIQQFVLDKDLAGSNRFITGFSRLIRQTLDISAKKEITLAEEIIYLSTYLELEKTRFEDKFIYEVGFADNINANDYMIPPMMLQPFVENSIRHGIRYRKDNDGKIRVFFEISDHDLVCTVEDNGIGRTEAIRLKSINPIEYQSKGMSLIASRIQYMNQNSDHPMVLHVEDLVDEKQRSMGTRVVLKFPLINTH